MKQKETTKKLKTSERILLGICALGLIVSGAFVASEHLYRRVFGSSSSSNQQAIGLLNQFENDTRYKPNNTVEWSKVDEDQPISIGDSVFTGEKSAANVKMKTGSEITMGANSLITFRSIDSIEVPNLAMGNFRVGLNGGMQLSINGELKELQGNAQFQVLVSQKGSQLKLIDGDALIKGKNGFEKLSGFNIAKEPKLPPPNHSVTPALSTAPYVHMTTVDDLYTVSGSDHIYSQPLNLPFRLRKEARRWVETKASISWTIQGAPEKIYGELSDNSSFAIVQNSFVAEPKHLKFDFNQVHLGDNFIRLSTDNQNWSATQSFRVLATTLGPAPYLKLSTIHIYMLNDFAVIGGQIRVSNAAKDANLFSAYILESTEVPDFSPTQTNVAWIDNQQVRVRVQHPGTYFMRVRGVDSRMQVSDVSAILPIVVEKPALPVAPSLANQEVHVYEGQEAKISWAHADQAQKYSVVVNDKTKNKQENTTISEPELMLKPKSVGEYNVSISSVDQFGRSSGSSNVRVIVMPRPVAPELVRAPAQASISEKIKDAFEDFNNRKFSNSNFALELGAFTAFSRNQLDAGRASPNAAFVGLRWKDWFGSNGFEGYFSSKLVDVNTPAGSQMFPVQVEARYQRRWILSLNPFSRFKPSQFSLIGGLEYYKNLQSGDFSPGYQLAKLGIGLEFPALKNWTAGGEALVGEGLDSTRKYELSGYMNYFWKVDWALGLGYRVYLMDAGSNASAPTKIPFREGVGQGYSVLKWYY